MKIESSVVNSTKSQNNLHVLSNSTREESFGKIYFNGKLFNDAYQNNWLNELAWFLHFSNKFNHKRFTISIARKEHGNKIDKIIRVLRSKELVVKRRGQIYLASNKEIRNQYGGKDKLFTPPKLNLNSIADIRKYLRLIPVTSNLYAQQKKSNIIRKFSTIKERSDQGKYLTPADYKFFKTYLKKVDSSKSIDLHTSCKSIQVLTGLNSKGAASNYRSNLERFGICRNKRSYELLKGHYRAILEVFPYAKKLDDGTIMIDKATKHLNLI